MTNDERLIAEIHKLSAENPESAQKLADWLDTTQGRPGTLVNSAEDGFENFISLFNELRGREFNSTTVAQAIGRIGHNISRSQLHYVPAQRRVDPRQHQADPNQKTGQFITDANKSPLDYAREAQARSAKNNPTAAESISVMENHARMEAESLRGNNHAETARLQRMYVMKPGTTSEIDWGLTLSARKQAQGSRSIR